jgi:hypothetical protein
VISFCRARLFARLLKSGRFFEERWSSNEADLQLRWRSSVLGLTLVDGRYLSRQAHQHYRYMFGRDVRSTVLGERVGLTSDQMNWLNI